MYICNSDGYAHFIDIRTRHARKHYDASTDILPMHYSGRCSCTEKSPSDVDIKDPAKLFHGVIHSWMSSRDAGTGDQSSQWTPRYLHCLHEGRFNALLAGDIARDVCGSSTFRMSHVGNRLPYLVRCGWSKIHTHNVGTVLQQGLAKCYAQTSEATSYCGYSASFL